MSALGWAGAVVVIVAGVVATVGGLVVGTAGFAFDKAGLDVLAGVGACAKADVATNAAVRMSARIMFMNRSWRTSYHPVKSAGEGMDNGGAAG